MGLLENLIRPIATISGLITGLWFLGVDPTTLLTGVGVVGIIVGLALQDSLSNLASGFFILVTRPYDVDDIVVVGGELGTVKAMGLANTTIITFDNRRFLVPNKKIWGDKIENRSAEPIRRVDATFKVGFSEDLEMVFNTLHDLRILDDPRPYIFVEKVDDSWMQLAVRPWVKNADWWYTLCELPRLIHARFEQDGISIPYPQCVITGQDPAGSDSGPSGS
jgi:small conductance mechanosensitive channel